MSKQKKDNKLKKVLVNKIKNIKKIDQKYSNRLKKLKDKKIKIIKNIIKKTESESIKKIKEKLT